MIQVKPYIAALGFLTLAGCASPPVLETQRVGDRELSCVELANEIEITHQFESDARDEKGVTGTNVAAAVFFWPALLVTSANVEDAIDAARERRRHLYAIYNEKDCESTTIE